jgi:hypothetical protein
MAQINNNRSQIRGTPTQQQKTPQQIQAEINALDEQASGRQNTAVKTGEGISQAGLTQLATGNWIVGTGICIAGMITKGSGYISEGKILKGLATMFGGHVGEGVAELAEGDSMGEVVQRQMGVIMQGAGIAGNQASQPGGKNPPTAPTGKTENENRPEVDRASENDGASDRGKLTLAK